MMSVNDIAIAADANDFWAGATDRRRASRKSAARLYHIRILMSHVYEALCIIKEISKSPALRAAVDECDSRVRAAYEALEAFVLSDRMAIFARLRNRATFHYDQQLPERSLDEIARIDPEKNWAYSVGSEALDWQFELADAVIDRIVIRDVFKQKMPRGPERRQNVETIAAEMDEIARVVTDFATYFVQYHLR